MSKRSAKILFATPPSVRKSSSFEAFSAGGSVFPSIGLLILAAIARERGYDVCFRDFLNTRMTVDQAADEAAAIDADCVAISANTDMIAGASALAAEVKKRKPETVTIAGGPHISAVPMETMMHFPSIDLGFIGESENSFMGFLDTDMDKKGLPWIKGVVFRQDGKIVVNERQPLIKDLDTLPFPAWDLIADMDIYRPAVTNYKRLPAFSLMTSRGCYGRCIFCDRGVFGGAVRTHGADYCMKMIRTLRSKFGINEITFYDDTMATDKKRLYEICNRIKAEERGLSWSASARVDQVDDDTLRAMKDAGCWQISYGIESGSDRILKAIKKGITVAQVKKAIELTKKHRITARGYFIIGSPGETPESLDETRELIQSLPLDDILVEYMTPYPGTELYKDVSSYGKMLGDWDSLNSYDMNFIPSGIDEKTLRQAFADLYKKFYLRPRVIASYAWRLKNPLKMFDLGMKYLKFSRVCRD